MFMFKHISVTLDELFVDQLTRHNLDWWIEVPTCWTKPKVWFRSLNYKIQRVTNNLSNDIWLDGVPLVADDAQPTLQQFSCLTAEQKNLLKIQKWQILKSFAEALKKILNNVFSVPIFLNLVSFRSFKICSKRSQPPLRSRSINIKTGSARYF